MRSIERMTNVAETHLVERLTWDIVASRLKAGAIAILPIGAAAKQHGFHLPMNTDRLTAEFLAAQVARRVDALIWPTVTYGYYPAFPDYAGSNSLSASLFQSLVGEIVADILRHGARAVVVLDTGISTNRPIDAALRAFDARTVLHLKAYDGSRLRDTAQRLQQQGHGSHADEIETSIMLVLAPEVVDMARAEASPPAQHATPGPLTPHDTSSPNYSRSGSYGDPTLATPAKGEELLTAMVGDLLDTVTAFLTGDAHDAIPRKQGVAR